MLLQGHVSVESRSPEDPEPRLAGTRKSRGEEGEDILSALEKIPGVGSLRSLGSMSSITLDRVKRDDSSHNLGSIHFDRVKREDSSHSLGPSPATSVSFFFLRNNI